MPLPPLARPVLTLGAALALFAVLPGCGGADYAADSDYKNAGDSDESPHDGSSDTGLPPEVEGDYRALRPAQTDVYIFIANPERDTVTRVHVFDLTVDTTPVGRDPRLVQTTPDYQSAVVFNRGDDTVSLLDANTLDTRTVEVRDNFNQMSMSPDGEWVTLWHDINAERPDDPRVEGLVSYNEASFVNVATGAHFPMAVGFNPKMVRYTPDSSLAVVVSDSSLALVDLTRNNLVANIIEVASDPLNPPPAEEVAIAPDGSYAFVRQFGATEIVVVDLATHVVSGVPVGVNPTDLDLAPDGKTAAVVARGPQEIWVYDVADPFAPATVIPMPIGETFGSLVYDPIGNQAMLYSTATLVDRYAVWDLSDDSVTVRSLVKPVQNMAITPTGESLLVFHTLEDAVGSTPQNNPFHGWNALTVISLDDLRANPLKLPAETIGYDNSSNGNYGYFIMDGEQFLEVLDYRTLLYDEIPLKSDPVFVGVLPDLDDTDGDEPPAWVSQQHDLGRITFYDTDDASTETITGFELNAHVQTGAHR